MNSIFFIIIILAQIFGLRRFHVSITQASNQGPEYKDCRRYKKRFFFFVGKIMLWLPLEEWCWMTESKDVY